MTQEGTPAPENEVEEVKGKDGEFVWKNPGMINERTIIDYVHWDDFAHSPDRNWADVERRGWVARKTAMTKREGVKRFGSKFSAVQLSMDTRIGETEKDKTRSGGYGDGEQKYAEVWEVWDAVSEEADLRSQGLRPDPRRNPGPLQPEQVLPLPAPGLRNAPERRPVPDA